MALALALLPLVMPLALVRPALPLPRKACGAAGVAADAACTITSFLGAGRAKAMLKFSVRTHAAPQTHAAASF